MALPFLPLLARAASLAKGAVEWYSFANEAFSWMGLGKRVASTAMALGVPVAATIAATNGVSKVVHEVQVSQLPFEIPPPTKTDSGSPVIPWGTLAAPDGKYLMALLQSECQRSRLSTDPQCIEVERAQKELASRSFRNYIGEMKKR